MNAIMQRSVFRLLAVKQQKRIDEEGQIGD